MSKISKKLKKQKPKIEANYEPGGRELAAHLQAQKEWKKRNHLL